MEMMTSEEKSRLEAQLSDLQRRRKQISDRIGAARELGDLSENAEYHAAREDQGLNEAKIRQLEDRLSRAVVVDTDSLPDDVVFMGATVKLRDVDTEAEDLYRLVGETTGDLSLDYVEVTPNSPMGLALMKARVGEVIRVDLPRGEKKFAIIEILA
jgi:transcription elongation factor GreA